MGLFQKTYTPEQWEKYKKDNPELFDPNHPDYDIIKSICGNKNIICMSDDIMYDIGGFVSL